MNDQNRDLETTRLAFEREKWNAEFALREREVKVKEDEARRNRWANPLVIAVLVAAFAAIVNVGVALVNSRAQISLEERKAEASRILEVVKIGDPDKAAANLKFLVDARLVSGEMSERIAEYLNNRPAGQGIALPPLSVQFGIGIRDEIAHCRVPRSVELAAIKEAITNSIRGIGPSMDVFEHDRGRNRLSISLAEHGYATGLGIPQPHIWIEIDAVSGNGATDTQIVFHVAMGLRGASLLQSLRSALQTAIGESLGCVTALSSVNLSAP